MTKFHPRPSAAIDAADQAIAEGGRAEAAGLFAEACEHYRAAVRSAPGYAASHLNLAIGLESAGLVDSALESYETALLLEPGNPFVNYNLGKLLYARGGIERAQRLLRAALDSRPAFAEAHVVLADLYESRGDLPGAAAELQAALAVRPGYAGALLNYAAVLARLGRHAEAAECYEKLIAAEPGRARTYWNLGNVLADQGRANEAADRYRQALALDPGFTEAQHSLCMLLYEEGRPADAIACLRGMLEQRPGFASGHISLGNILSSERRLEEAAEAHQRALAIDPGNVAAHLGLGDSYRARDAMAEARRCYAKALEVDAENVQARWSLALSSLHAVYETEQAARQGPERFARELDEVTRWLTESRLRRAVDAAGNPPPFYLAYREEDNRELLRRHGSLCCSIMEQWRRAERLPEVESARRNEVLRVGVVSAHLHDHSVWNALLKGWFRHLDRERFSLEAFYLGTQSDAETQAARSLTAHFESGRGNLRAWAQAIAARRLDVLIYPEIGMDAMTLKLASLRLAPVQISTWGHPETTGLQTIDYYLSAEGLEPEGAASHYTERLVLLPGLGCCYPDRQLAADAPELGSRTLDPSTPMLICPGTPFKYAPRYDVLLADIASRLPEARLVFFAHRVPELSARLHARLQAAFSARGLDAGKSLVFLPWQSLAQFRGLMGRARLFLDTVGFSGFNTAMEAVQCGLPIVTREGRFLRGRLASGILKRMQLDELVAPDDQSYVDLAVRMCRDHEYREQLGAAMAARKELLFEDRSTVRALEEVLLRVAAMR